MPVKQPQIYIPTGYEAEQRKAERKRKLAQMMLERGLGPQGHMQSWTQVLAQAANAGVGKFLDKKADKLTDETNEKIKADWLAKNQAFSTDEASMAPGDLWKKYRTDPMLADTVEPYKDAMTSALKQRAERRMFGGRLRTVGDIGEQEVEPSSPNDMLITGPDGNVRPNIMRINTAMGAQGLLTPEGMQGLETQSMPDPRRAGMPAQPAMGGENNLDLNLLSPEERQIMQRELARRAAGNTAGANIPNGNPLDPAMAAKPPIPPQAIQMLRSNPNLAQFFDQKYGPGSAEEVLRGQ